MSDPENVSRLRYLREGDGGPPTDKSTWDLVHRSRPSGTKQMDGPDLRSGGPVGPTSLNSKTDMKSQNPSSNYKNFWMVAKRGPYQMSLAS